MTDDHEFLVLIIFIFDELNRILPHCMYFQSSGNRGNAQPLCIGWQSSWISQADYHHECHMLFHRSARRLLWMFPSVHYRRCMFVLYDPDDRVYLQCLNYLSLRYEMIRWARTFIVSTVVAANRIISSIAICTSSFPFVLCNDWTIFPYCCHWVWNIVCGVNCLLYSKQLSWYAVSLNKLAVFSCWVVLVVSVIVGSSLCLDQMQWHCSSYFRQKRKN